MSDVSNTDRMVEATIDSVVMAITDKAVGFVDETDGEIWLWLPISECEELEGLRHGDVVDTLSVPRWLADDKELEYA